MFHNISSAIHIGAGAQLVRTLFARVCRGPIQNGFGEARSVQPSASRRHGIGLFGSWGTAVVMLLAAPLPLRAQDLVRPEDTTRCMGLFAHADDPDPAGLNVRAGPSTSAPIIGVLKFHTFARDAMGRDLLQAPRFEVIGSHDGWLLVDNFAYPDPPQEPPLPSGQGWVHGSRVSVHTFDEAAPTARLYAQKDGGGPSKVINGATFSVLGCDRRWIEVRERVLPGAAPGRTGWLAAPDICVNQMGLAQVVNVCNNR